jgi:hypothetical protein
MPRETMPTDATFESIAGLLVDPIIQVREVLNQLVLCRGVHNNSHVRLGITGDPSRPFYKIYSNMDNGEEEAFGTFQDEALLTPDAAWSTRSSSVSEIQDLLRQLAG